MSVMSLLPRLRPLTYQGKVKSLDMFASLTNTHKYIQVALLLVNVEQFYENSEWQCLCGNKKRSSMHKIPVKMIRQMVCQRC